LFWCILVIQFALFYYYPLVVPTVIHKKLFRSTLDFLSWHIV
uniref:Ovule protein n=1 Tax=Brugia timori TaxID=42155 RepID=A0A0R3QGI9_9BILA